MFSKMVDRVVERIVVVHVDDILVGDTNGAYDELHLLLNKKLYTNNLREVRWYMGCGTERDWEKDTIKITQTAFVDTLLKRFNITARTNTPASPAADLEQTTADDEVIDGPFRQAVGGSCGWPG